MKKASITDIANALLVSPTTVSFILNGKAREKRISIELVEKQNLVLPTEMIIRESTNAPADSEMNLAAS